MTTVTIPLKNRAPMVFEGEEIAFITSQREGVPRWTEMRVYLTDDGRFVFRRTGVSVKYHRPTCGAILGRMDLKLEEDPGDDLYPCEDCLPETDDDPVLVESNKEYARMTGDLRQLIVAVQERDKNTGALTFTPMSRQLLEIAAERQPEIIEYVRERMLAAAAGE